MAARLSLPGSQQRHSNVAVVRLAKGKSAIEIACYKNKVVAYRNGAESNVDEVIQIDRVFSNVARGEFASMMEIRNIIGDVTERQAVEHILKHGTVQVAERERTVSQEELMKDICTIVAQKLVHPVTKRPYAALFLEETLRSLGFNAKVDQPAKKQALGFIKELIARQVVPVARAQMRLKIQGPDAASHIAGFAGGATVVESRSEVELHIDIDPELFREVMAYCAERGLVSSVVEYAVSETSQGDAAAVSELLTDSMGRGAMPTVAAAAQRPRVEKPAPAPTAPAQPAGDAVGSAASKTAARKAKRAERQSKRNARANDDSDSD